MSCARCDNVGHVGTEWRCPCTRENEFDELDRVKAERDLNRAHITKLEKMLLEARQANAALVAERERLVSQRLAFLEKLGERAAALQAALNLDGARLLMSVVKELADA